jgi:monoamine oxidase
MEMERSRFAGYRRIVARGRHITLTLDLRAVVLGTPVGAVRTRAVILTVSTAVVAGGTIMLQDEADPWRHAAARLPLGRNEKLFPEITGDSPFVH